MRLIVLIVLAAVLAVVLAVILNAMIAMMYITGVIGLLVLMEAAELEMEIVNNIPNYLNSIVNYKFGNQCIYCIPHR